MYLKWVQSFTTLDQAGIFTLLKDMSKHRLVVSRVYGHPLGSGRLSDIKERCSERVRNKNGFDGKWL
jgi:hypothetical protein